MTYDLLVKGGHVLDPGQGLDGTLDIAISGGKISRIAADIPAEEAARVIATGRASRPGSVPACMGRRGRGPALLARSAR